MSAEPANQALVPVAQPPAAQPAPAAPKVAVGSRQMRHLAQSIVLEESGTSPMVRLAVLLVCVATALFITWAWFTHVTEVAVTQGQVIPSGQVKTVQHLEGGIVSAVLVDDGTLVEAGQPLIRLNPAQAMGDLEQTRARRAGLMARAERLRAYIENREPDFHDVGAGWEDVIADQKAMLVAQRQALNAGLDVLQAQVDQKRAEIELFRQQLIGVEKQLTILAEVIHMRAELLEKGLQSKVVYLDNKRELARQEAERGRLKAQIRASEESLNEMEKRVAERRASLFKDAVEELGRVTGDLSEVRETLSRLYDRVTRLEIDSPVRGLVQNRRVQNAGAVIPPGGIVCEVVPVDRALQVEARVTSRDIGHIHVGQKVTVKVTTYDFSRYGAIEGEVEQLSPTSFLDEHQQAYYKAIIALKADHVGGDPANRVLPGMTVQADVITGDKTLLQYLLKPIYLAVQQSFHER